METKSNDVLRQEILNTLPAGWEFARDLIVIVGDCGGRLVEKYRGVGQEKLVVLVPELAAYTTEIPDDVIVCEVRSLVDVVKAVGHGVVHHAWVARVPEGGFDDDDMVVIREKITIAMRARLMNVATIESFGRDWILQSMNNLPLVSEAPGVCALARAFLGRPAVVVSPGPSLSKQLELLATLGDRAVVIAGAHALHALQDAGVRVDVAMVIDAGEEVQRHFEGIDVGRLGSLVVSLVVNEGLARLPVESRFVVSVNGAIDSWPFEPMGDRPAISSGGSVSCAGFSLAQVMGCDPIVLVGQDLAMTDGQMYAAETLDGSAGVSVEQGGFILKKPVGAEGPGYRLPDGSIQFSRVQKLSTLPGYYGGSVQTSSRLEQFHNWFEMAAERNETKVRLVNATEGGANIRGMENVPFAEMVESFTERFPVREVLRDASRVTRSERAGACVQHIRVMKRSLDESALIAERCARLVERARGDARALDQLGRMEQDLRVALEPVRFFTMFAQSELDKARMAAFQAKSLDENLDAVRTLMQVVVDAVDLLRQPLEDAEAELASSI